MASTVATTENPQGIQTEEVRKIESKYGKDCRVIKNIGDFTHVIEVKLHRDTDMSIKFQLEASYPETAAHIIVRSKTLRSEDIDILALHLAAVAERQQGALVIQPVLNEALTWLEQTAPRTASHGGNGHHQGCTKPQRQNGRKHRRQRQQEEQLSEEESNQKKPPMKTAMDVVYRILWDSFLNRKYFTIGYLDRMVGVVEKNFEAFSWEDVASVDYNTLAIPKHRIQYFKYRDLKVWDKNSRLDDVFGSQGGRTIVEVIEKYERDHPSSMTAGNYDEHSENDGDDDDGITIDTGCNIEGAVGPAPAFHPANGMSSEEDSEETDAPWNSEDRYWGPKKRPTHFLALRVTDPDVVAAVARIHEVIIDTEPSYTACIIPCERLHVTLACLGLDTPDDVARAASTLDDIKENLTSSGMASQLEINFSDIGQFFHNVLYAKVAPDERFCRFVQAVRSRMASAGVELRDVFEFTPHMTLVKLKRQLGREVLHTRYLDSRLSTLLAGSHLGVQRVDNIHLCEMSEDRTTEGFYVCPHSVTLS